MSKTTTSFSEREQEQEKIKGLNNGMGYAIIKTSRLNDLQLCGRQDIMDIPCNSQIFGKDYHNYSIVIKVEHPNAKSNLLFAFQKELRDAVKEYVERKMAERLIRAEPQTASVSETSQQPESQTEQQE